MNSFVKLYRFAAMYGLLRTFFKVVSRTRVRFPLSVFRNNKSSVAIIGCGQYAFATIGYFISSVVYSNFRWCYDPNTRACSTFHFSHKVLHKDSAALQCLDDKFVKYVYIASNHSTHSDYAVSSLKKGKVVFVEKPIAVSYEQLARLERQRVISEADGSIKLYAGYNRPFSAVIGHLVDAAAFYLHLPLSLSCFVSGHQLDEDHWYRNPTEGTRICGNAGHWIDLFVYLCSRGGRIDGYTITLLASNPSTPDDDFSLSISTERGDIFNLMMTSRCEPFEGISEAINFQQGNIISKIDDFRKLTIWHGAKKKTKRFFHKDVGHSAAILQPFNGKVVRSFSQIFDSTVIILNVTDMIQTHEHKRNVCLKSEKARILSLEREFIHEANSTIA